MRFSAVLLAGGKSSRMGRDKAFLEIGGEPLWRRQRKILRQLGPAQLMISGPRREEWSNCDVVCDEIENAGPLAGVAAALANCTSSHLVVLAIDLPRMSSNFLQLLLALCGPNRGAVPRRANGFEPLAAVYPASCAIAANAVLQGGEFSMQSFVRKGMDESWLVAREISTAEDSLFINLNTPADL